MSAPSALPLPHSLEAEKAVLGAVLLDNARLVDVQAVLQGPEDFFRDAHRRIFRHMAQLAAKRRAIDLLTLRDELAAELEDVGGAAYIAALVDGVPRGTNVEHYARIVREKAALRALIAGANTMLHTAYEADEEAAAILERAERTILGLADHTVSTGFESMETIAPRALALLEHAYSNRGTISGVPTGFTELDDLTRGLQPGTLVVLGARPGVGKTSFAQNVAYHAAAAGKVVGYFNLEMPNDELFMRQIASHARLDSHRLQSGYVAEREWARISEAIAFLSAAPVFSDDTAAIGLFEVRSRARRLKIERGLNLLILDYLQLMSTAGDYDTRTLEIGAITSGLKALAKELKVPILLLSQLSRETEKRGTKPKLSDLRDSGSIEQDADIVLFMWRPDVPDPADPGVTDLIVAKHRNGPVGTIRLAWFEEQTRFATYAAREQPEDRRLPMGDR